MGQKAEDTKRSILQKATVLFSQSGYSAVSMQDICTACALSKGGLYRYYESKEQLFTDLLRALQAEEAQRELVRKAGDEPATAILNSFLEHIRTELHGAAPGIDLAVYEFCMEHRDGAGGEFVLAQLERGKMILASLIEYGVRHGEFTAIRPQETAESVLILLEGLKLLSQAAPLSKETTEGVFRQIWRLVGRDDV